MNQHKRIGIPLNHTDYLALLSGLITPLAFAPFHFSPVIFLSLVVLFRSWRYASPIRAFCRGFLFGLGMFGIGTYWIYISIHDFGGAGYIASSGLSLMFFSFFALFPAMVGLLSGLCFKTSPIITSVLICPTAWTLMEWFRSLILNGFPWMQVGYTQLDSPLATFIPLVGAYGVNWLVAAIASVLLIVCSVPRWKKLVLIGIVCSIFITGWLFKEFQWTYSIGDPIKATLLQGNISQDQKWLPAQKRRTLELYKALTLEHLDSKIVIWPETAVPFFFHQAKEMFFLPLKRETLQHEIDLVFGVPVQEKSGARYYNALITLGKVDGIYKKRHLVPFGEYVPWQPFTGFIANLLNIPLANFVAGNDRQSLMWAAGYPFAASICYEDGFGDTSLMGLPEAAYLVNVTNDGWFGNSFASYQHLHMARMRSLETGRYMLRATNTGITAVISPSGIVVKSAPRSKTTALTAEITPMGGSTPYIIYGDKPVIIGLFILLGCGLLICFITGPKHGRKNNIL